MKIVSRETQSGTSMENSLHFLFSLSSENFPFSARFLTRKPFRSNKRLKIGKMEYEHIHLIHPNKTMKRNRKQKMLGREKYGHYSFLNIYSNTAFHHESHRRGKALFVYKRASITHLSLKQ